LRCPGALFFALLVVPGNSSLHLNSPSDREAFRRWFTFLAESQFYARKPAPEILDCAGLVRWSFREALTRHDSAWAAAINLPVLPALPSIGQPHLPGINLFRTGATSAGQFADATVLRRYNTFFVARELDQARPGDLLFYRQYGRTMPAHVMIYIGASQVEPSPRKWIVYHTGPSGEIRKVLVQDLMAHPAPEWRPDPGNSNFLGVWRWNLLRGSE
jgi:uncharacterized protein YfaT (DUF1175 family)